MYKRVLNTPLLAVSNLHANTCSLILYGLNWPLKLLQSKVVARRCSVKKVFLKMSKNSQENTCARVSNLQAAPATLLQKEASARVFSCEFCKFLRTLLLENNLSGCFCKITKYNQKISRFYF